MIKDGTTNPHLETRPPLPPTTTDTSTATTTVGATTTASSEEEEEEEEEEKQGQQGGAIDNSSVIVDIGDNSVENNVLISKRRRNKRSIRRLAAVPWAFSIFGLVLTLCTLSIVVSLQYITLSDNVEKMVISRATAVLGGAVSSVQGYRSKVERVTERIHQDLSKAGNASQDPYLFLNSLNSTLHRVVRTRVLGMEVNGVFINILAPPTPLSSIPEQDLEEQSKCSSFCTRPDDPSYSVVMPFIFIRDYAPGQDVQYRFMYPNPNNTGSFYAMKATNRTMVPSWAATEELSNMELIPVSYSYRTESFVTSYGNGTAFDGIWNPTFVTSSSTAYSYYFTDYKRASVHPLSNMTISVNILTAADTFQKLLVKQLTSQLSSTDQHLLLVDQSVRVIAYNHDIYGDSRLANCSITVAPNTPGRQCGDFYAIDHPTPFIAQLFQSHKDLIMSFTDGPRLLWFRQGGVKYLLLAQDVSPDEYSRLAVVFVLSESDVVGSLKRDTLIIVIIGAVIALVGCLCVTAAGFGSLSSAQRVVVLVARLAVSIARYDVDAADQTIEREQSSRLCFKDPTPIEKRFSEILGNLRNYRPFLPASMLVASSLPSSGLVGDGTSSLNTSSSSLGSTSPVPRYVHRTAGFTPFSGTLLLVDVGNLPIASHIVRRNSDEGASIINSFLNRCLRIVEVHGGVVELMQASQLLVSFNTHSKVQKHQQVACHCALQLQASLTGKNGWCAHRINVAISVASGEGILGSAGSSTVKARVISGEPVDLVRRLPSLQRQLGVAILTTEATAQALIGTVVTVPVDVIAPMWNQAGRTSPIVVYDVVGVEKLLSPKVIAESATRSLGFTHLYQKRNPAKAATVLLRLPTSVIERFCVSRLVYLSEIFASSFSAGGVRNELPWDELEGRDFFDRYSSEQLASALEGVKDANPSSLLMSSTTSYMSSHMLRANHNPCDDDDHHHQGVFEINNINSPFPERSNSGIGEEEEGEERGLLTIVGGAEKQRQQQGCPLFNASTTSLVGDGCGGPSSLISILSGGGGEEGDGGLGSSSSSPQNISSNVHGGSTSTTLQFVNHLVSKDHTQQQHNRIHQQQLCHPITNNKNNNTRLHDHHNHRLPSSSVSSSRQQGGCTNTTTTEANSSCSNRDVGNSGLLLIPLGSSNINDISQSNNVQFRSTSSRSPAMTSMIKSSSCPLSPPPSMPSQSPYVTTMNGERYFPSGKRLGVTGSDLIVSPRRDGEGGGGEATTTTTVVLALHETGCLVAMKQMPLTNNVQCMIKEVDQLASLNHPNISSYVACAINRYDDTFCVMMEYLPAGSLLDLINISCIEPRYRSEPHYCMLSVSTITKFAAEMASGLHYLHTRTPPILHLNVKPQNVLMTAEGSCKLIDFGTSRLVQDRCLLGGGGAEGGLPSTEYTAPEAALGEFSPASDIYSLGVTVLHMLLGRLPDTILDARSGHPQVVIPGWIDDPQLATLLEECTSPHPSQRPTAKAILDRIHTF